MKEKKTEFIHCRCSAKQKEIIRKKMHKKGINSIMKYFWFLVERDV